MKEYRHQIAIRTHQVIQCKKNIYRQCAVFHLVNKLTLGKTSFYNQLIPSGMERPLLENIVFLKKTRILAGKTG